MTANDPNKTASDDVTSDWGLDSANDGAATPGENGPELVDIAVLAQAEERIAKLEGEVAAAKDAHLRAVAEMQNSTRRAQKEREDTQKYAVTKFAGEMLGIADNLRRAIEAVPEAERENTALKPLLDGVEMTERLLLNAFEQQGIKKLDPLDQPFDPNFHRVMFEMPMPGKAPGTVVQVLQPGYVIHDRLLREAMVGIAKADAAGSSVDTTA